jgi:hypothetical protein
MTTSDYKLKLVSYKKQGDVDNYAQSRHGDLMLVAASKRLETETAL